MADGIPWTFCDTWTRSSCALHTHSTQGRGAHPDSTIAGRSAVVESCASPCKGTGAADQMSDRGPGDYIPGLTCHCSSVSKSALDLPRSLESM